MKTGGYDSLLSKCILYIFYTYIVKEVYHVYTSKFSQLVTHSNKSKYWSSKDGGGGGDGFSLPKCKIIPLHVFLLK